MTPDQMKELRSKITEYLQSDHVPYRQAAYRDLFALGCYLHFVGNKEAGRKAIRTAFGAIQLPDSIESRFFKILEGNEKECFTWGLAHSEIKSLMKESSSSKPQ